MWCVACFLVGCDTEDFDITPDEVSKQIVTDGVSIIVNNETEVQLSPKQKEELANRLQNSASPRAILGECDCEIIVNSVKYNGSTSWDGQYELLIPDDHDNSDNCINAFYLLADTESCYSDTNECTDDRIVSDGSTTILSDFNDFISEYESYTLRWIPGVYSSSSCLSLDFPTGNTFEIDLTIECIEPDGDGGSLAETGCSPNAVTLYSTNATITIDRPVPAAAVEASVSLDLEGCGCKPTFGAGGGGIGN